MWEQNPKHPNCQKKKKKVKEKEKKTSYIPLVVQTTDDLGIGGQLMIPIIPPSIGRQDDRDSSRNRPTSDRHQARIESFVLHH